MQKQIEIIQSSLTERVYSRAELFDLVYRWFPAYSENSCNWLIGLMCKEGVLRALGGGYFGLAKQEWDPKASSRYEKAMGQLVSEMPFTEISFIDTKALNEMSMMAGGPDCLILGVSKKDLFPAYMKLREIYKRDVLLTPTQHELNFYMKPEAIILRPLFSKSPCNADGRIALEKLLVDLYADRMIDWLYPGVNFEDSMRENVSQYNVNLFTTMNYAKRRRVYSQVRDFLLAAITEEEAKIIKEAYPDD